MPTAGCAEALHSFVVAESARILVALWGVVGWSCRGKLRYSALDGGDPDGGEADLAGSSWSVRSRTLNWGVKALYLLTTRRRGTSLALASRRRPGRLAEAVKQSVRVCSGCPASATVMVLDLAKR